MEIIATLNPKSTFIRDVARKPAITGIRFNTSAEMDTSAYELLKRLKDEVYPKDLWVDLKCRQLRVTEDAVIPKDSLKVSHRLTVRTPTEMWYKESIEDKTKGTIEEVYIPLKLERVEGWGFVAGGSRLKVQAPPGTEVHFGRGAAVSIMDPSLKVHGYLTKRDKEFIDAAKQLDMHKYMISFVEQDSDLADIVARDPKAEILAKIESNRGLNFVENVYPKSKYKEHVTLMAARGDMYVWLDKPHYILNATKKIIKADPNAYGASRIMESLTRIKPEQMPDCADITDVGYLLELGYRNFLLGDAICYDKQRLSMAIGILDAIMRDYGSTL